MKINKIKSGLKLVLPQSIVLKIKKSVNYNYISSLIAKVILKPSWNEIKGGVLRGGNIFINPKGAWKEMISGEYDEFFFDYLDKLDLTGKTIYDVGAHIGYSSMSFAKLVGPTGKVFAFEPNIFNKERFELILSKNRDLSSIIRIFDVAISDKIGEETFIFNDNVDNSKSSGSFIEGANTFFEKNFYEKSMGFKRVNVKTVTLDSLETIGIIDKPTLIKIDIEGAEYLAINGGLEILTKYKPILLIEIHSIFNMYKVYECLNRLNYKTELLKEEKDGRCFISAVI